jgi:hypothetical protein
VTMPSDFNPLSHDAFIVLSELESLGNQCTRELLTEAVYKRGIKGLDTLILELVKANQVFEDNSKQLIIACSSKQLRTACSSTLNSYNPQNYSFDKAILSTAVKGLHAGYQAVVHGKKAKWSAIHAYAEKLSRADLPHYWKMIGAMTDAERVQFNRRVARLVARSG